MSLYNFFGVVASCSVAIYNLLHFRQKKMMMSRLSCRAIDHFKAKKKKLLASLGFWFVVETVLISWVQILPAAILNPAFGNLVGTGANYYGLMLVVPWVLFGLCLLVKIDPLAQLDLIAPAYPLALIFTKIACFFGGCCRGVRWIYGFYNPVSRLIEFPIQLLEALVGLLLFVLLLLIKSRLKKGTVFPVYLMLYSAIRFFTEFLRVEPEVFMGLKTYQILCIIGVAVGALEYWAACRYKVWVRRKEEQCHSRVKTSA